MKPINRLARISAIYKFIGLYGLTILAVILGAYFLFNTPAGILKNRIQLYKNTEDEQDRLVNKADAMTLYLNSLVQTDKNYLGSSNDIEKGNLQTKINEYQKSISNVLVELQNDSIAFISPIAKRNAYNYITAFNTILSYKGYIVNLQNSLASKGVDASDLARVNADLQACKLNLSIATLAASNSSKATTPPPSGGSSSGGSSAKEAQLQQALEKCQSDYAALQKAKTGPVVPVPIQPSDESKKAIVLFEAGQDLYNNAEKTKNLIERRGILSSAKQLFQSSTASFPEPDKVKKAINLIDSELKKLSNMG